VDADGDQGVEILTSRIFGFLNLEVTQFQLLRGYVVSTTRRSHICNKTLGNLKMVFCAIKFTRLEKRHGSKSKRKDEVYWCINICWS